LEKRGVDREKSRFSLVNRSLFETERNVVKSTISQSQVWRVCQFFHPSSLSASGFKVAELRPLLEAANRIHQETLTVSMKHCVLIVPK
jgi:hypothetical protein